MPRTRPVAPSTIVREWFALQSLVLDHAADILDRERAARDPLPAMRLAVARSLAAHDVVLQPADWARTVRDMVDVWTARERRNPASPIFLEV